VLISEIDVAVEVGGHFDALGVVWLVGGSVASSLLGVPRATDDVDLVADLRDVHVAPLCARMRDVFYLDEDAVRWAVATRRTFNAIHLVSMIKVDVYCSKDDALARAQLERRQLLALPPHQIPVCTAEDIILQKLLWFVEGGRVSDRQWRDLLGVVRVHRDQLDRAYLEQHARAHALIELLDQLFAGSPPG
jgi:sulfur transfer complex TusBCD TusB component (DsrH family)